MRGYASSSPIVQSLHASCKVPPGEAPSPALDPRSVIRWLRCNAICEHGLIGHADLVHPDNQVDHPTLAIGVQVFSADGALSATHMVRNGGDGRPQLLFSPLTHPGL